MTIVEPARLVTGGVDTHLDVHVAAALDGLGVLLGTESFSTTPAGYGELFDWFESFGPLARVGVEGTGSYGAGLARSLMARGVEVVEVDCPNRKARHRAGKSDTIDAISAARGALSGHASGQPKSGTGPVEAMRVLLVAKRSARSERVRTLNQMRHLVFVAPDDIRARFHGLNVYHLTRQAAAMRPRPGNQVNYNITLMALRQLGRRANSALHRIVLVRMGHHEPTRVYVERRRGEGHTNPKIMRSLKRYVARETFKQLPRGDT